jgi:hypothetical protein
MRILILLLALAHAVPSFSQNKKDKYINFLPIKPVKFPKSDFSINYFREYEIGKTDTTYYFVLLFQNASYSATSDSKMIAFSKAEEYNQFLADINSINTELLNGSLSDLSWRREKYNLIISEKSESVTISVNDMSIKNYITQTSGYAYLTKTHLENLLISLKNITFGFPIEK